MTDFESALDVQTDALVTATIGCAITVHKTLGPGFLERAYERALHLELEAQGIEFEAQVPIWVTYRERQLMAQRLDLVVGGSVLVEIRMASDASSADHKNCPGVASVSSAAENARRAPPAGNAS